MSESLSRVAIILVNWNGWRDCIECISSIYGSEAPEISDIWIVDNDSSDGSVDRIAQWCANPRIENSWLNHDGVRHVTGGAIECHVWDANGCSVSATSGRCLNIVRSGSNLGFAGGNNVGIEAAGLERYDYFWLLNTDTVIRYNALHELLHRVEGAVGLGMVGSSLILYSKPDRLQAQGGSSLDKEGLRASHIGEGSQLRDLPVTATEISAVEAKMSYVVGASMLVSSAFIRDIGPMCEDYFLYFEELDWAYRARGRYTLGYAPKSWVFHKVGGSSSKPQSEFSLNLLYRNQILFAARFMPSRIGQVQRKLFIELLRQAIKGQWVAVRLLYCALRDRRSLAAAGSHVSGQQR